MKYKAALYAQALAAVAEEKRSPAEEKKVRENFLAILEKNGDTRSLGPILEETERILRKKNGERKITIETARAIPKDLRASVEKILRAGDTIEEKVNPALVAGIRLTADGESQFDASLIRKLDKLFAEEQ